MATRADAIASAREHLHSGAFLGELGRRVGYRTESQNPGSGPALRAYLEENLRPAFADLGFATWMIESPTGKGPYLLANYHEDDALPTMLTYGHGDVVDGMDGEWRDHLDPWQATTKGDRVYGRGTADNKGQHSINMSAHARGARGPWRQARLQRQIHHRDRRGDRLAGPAQGLRGAARGTQGRSCSSPPTGRDCRPIAPPSSSAAAAAIASISTSTCARAGTIPAIGAACSPIPRRSSPTPSQAWSTARAA